MVELERYFAEETLRGAYFWAVEEVAGSDVVEGFMTSEVSSTLATVEECWEGWCLVAPVSYCWYLASVFKT